MIFFLKIFIYKSAKKPDEKNCKVNEQTLADFSFAHTLLFLSKMSPRTNQLY